MPDQRPSSAAVIDDIANGFRSSQILLTANRLGVFAAIGTDALGVKELASTLNADTRGVRILCDALVAVSLLEKRDEKYTNSQSVLDCLLPDSPHPKSAMLTHTAVLYERWAKLFDTVKSGQPPSDEEIDLSIPRDKHGFTLAMADVARVSAKNTADRLDLSSVKRLLDVGGGPGLYAIEFAERYKQLEAVVFDFEEPCRIAQENIQNAGLADRVSVRIGNIFEDDIGTGYDFILLSNFIHTFSYRDSTIIISKCARGLSHSGRICVKDFVLDSDRTSPAGAAVFAVNMLVGTKEGGCYTLEEIQNWFHNAGLQTDSIVELTAQSRLVIAEKER